MQYSGSFLNSTLSQMDINECDKKNETFLWLKVYVSNLHI